MSENSEKYSKSRILIIEDEPDILEVLQYNLEREGFQTLSARDGVTGVSEAQKRKPTLILLDLMLPRMDGLEVCRQLRSLSDTKEIPIIMVTAKGEETDVVLGLELGADDYITKPFSPKEVVARIRALLRRTSRSKLSSGTERIEVGPIVIDSGRFEVQVHGAEISLTRAEFRLLHTLATNPGRVLTRDQLLDKVTGGESVVIDRNVDVHIGTIRKKLGEEGARISTVRGVGYKLQD